MSFVRLFAAILLGLAVPSAAHSRERYNFDQADKSCDGYPALPIETAEGYCIGIVLGPEDTDGSKHFSVLLPRRLLALPGNKGFLLTDLGNWAGRSGRVWWLKKNASNYELVLLYGHLNHPHGLALGSDGQIYVGLSNGVARFKFVESNTSKPRGESDLEFVISLPDRDDHAHPLTQIDFVGAREMLVTLGAPSNDCHSDIETWGECRERALFAAILRYRQSGAGKWVQTDDRATGLRNPLALAHHSSGSVWAADNGIDLPSDSSPLEPLFHIQLGHSYGWPYCINDGDALDRADAPTLHQKCDGEERPYALLPAHVAPLDMAFVRSPLFKGENLLMTWHGYRPDGARIVALPVDAKGFPQRGGALSTDGFQYPVEVSKLVPVMIDLVLRWDLVPGLRPMGAPVGIAMAADGSIWIAEDKNRTILRMARGQAYRPSEQNQKALASYTPEVELAFDTLRTNVLGPRCGQCHQQQLMGTPSKALLTIRMSGWLNAAVERISEISKRQMPPDQPLSDAEKDQLTRFVRMLEN